jgi:hypothetical protein
MRKDKKYKQRQEVRRILAEVRKELRDFKIDYEELTNSQSASRLDKIVERVRSKPKRQEA